MNTAKHGVSGANVPSNSRSGGTMRLMKWIVLIVLLVLLLLALFLPDRGLAGLAALPPAGHGDSQDSLTRLPTASSTPSENRMRTRSASISNGTAMRASSW